MVLPFPLLELYLYRYIYSVAKGKLCQIMMMSGESINLCCWVWHDVLPCCVDPRVGGKSSLRLGPLCIVHTLPSFFVHLNLLRLNPLCVVDMFDGFFVHLNLLRLDPLCVVYMLNSFFVHVCTATVLVKGRI